MFHAPNLDLCSQFAIETVCARIPSIDSEITGLQHNSRAPAARNLQPQHTMSAAGVNAAAKAAARAAAAPAKATAQAGAASASASSASSTAKLLAPAPDTVPMKYSWETGNYVAAVPIQSESELHPLKRFNVKKFRLHPSFRLRKVSCRGEWHN